MTGTGTNVRGKAAGRNRRRAEPELRFRFCPATSGHILSLPGTWGACNDVDVQNGGDASKSNRRGNLPQLIPGGI